jgi:hypothetical protein
LHRIAFVLAILFAVLSTQPIWQPLKQAMFGNCGGGTACSASAAPHGCPSGNDDPASTDGCCAPFSCSCFPCFSYCQQPVHFPDFAEGEKNTRPGEDTKPLHSASIGGHFQPPELS